MQYGFIWNVMYRIWCAYAYNGIFDFAITNVSILVYMQLRYRS